RVQSRRRGRRRSRQARRRAALPSFAGSWPAASARRLLHFALQRGLREEAAAERARLARRQRASESESEREKSGSPPRPFARPDRYSPMAIPPAYADLGKSARDIFNKGFEVIFVAFSRGPGENNILEFYGAFIPLEEDFAYTSNCFGLVKLDVKTKSTSGVEFATSGSSNTDTGKVNGSLETKYKWAEYGVTFTEKWNTDNTLGTEMAIEDQIAKGLKLTFDTTFSPNTGKKSGKIKSAYKRECINLGCDVDFDFAGPAIHGSVVLGYEGWLAGYQMTFDSAKSKLTRNNFSVGYKTGDFQLHTNVNDGSEFGGSIYQKTKVNNSSLIGIGYTQSLRPAKVGGGQKGELVEGVDWQVWATASAKGKFNVTKPALNCALPAGVKLTLSALVDGKNINAGGHKLGLGLELEA
ncbi:hypothetical protein Chor_013685, partial [Crotalus horridus]